MADTVIRGEERLTARLLRPLQGGTVRFVPLEGLISVTAGGVEAVSSGTGGGRAGGGRKPQGKQEPDPDAGGGSGGVVLKQHVRIRVTLQPPSGTGPSKSKTFEIRDVLGGDALSPLELGVRPEQAGRTWQCVFTNAGRTPARIFGAVGFVKERHEEEPPPAEVSIGKDATSPAHFMQPNSRKVLQFRPTAGLISVLVGGFETEFDKVVGKAGPEEDIGLEIRQNVRIGVELHGPSGRVKTAQFRSTKVMAESADKPRPIIEHVVPDELADRTWECHIINRGKTDIRGFMAVEFVGRALRTDIPLRVLNNGLRQLIAAIGLGVRLDGNSPSVGVSPELKKFASQELGVSLDFPAELNDVDFAAFGVRARTDTGRPVISATARLATYGQTVAELQFVGVDLGDVDVDARLAISFDVQLNRVERNGRSVLVPATIVDVDAQVFIEALTLANINLSDAVVDGITDKLRELADSKSFQDAVSKYVSAGLVHLVQQGHEFQDLRAVPGAFSVLHTNPRPDEPPSPAQPPHVELARGDIEPASLSEVDRARLARIDHVVVLMQENRSFDHLLGYLSHPDHGLPRLQADGGRDVPDGLHGGESNSPKDGGDAVVVTPYADADVAVFGIGIVPATAVPYSPHHDHDNVKKQINEGLMDGFVANMATRFNNVAPKFFMSFYTDHHVPVFDALAAEYLVCDRWFCSYPGPTQPNRFCTLSGHTPTLDNFAFDDQILGYLRMPILFDTLNDAGVDWVYYEGDIGFVRMYDRYRLDDEHVIPYDDPVDGFRRRAELGTLPPVTFIDPNFTDIPPVAIANDDHAPADIARGQRLVQEVHDTLVTSPRWHSQGKGTLLIVTYDEHGGFHDHVPPPGTPPSDAPDPVPPIHPDGDPFYGCRVPTFVISPFVRAGAVDSTIYDHTSIMATILHRFIGEIPAEFGPRPAVAKTLAGALTLEEGRRPQPLRRSVPTGAVRLFRDHGGGAGDLREVMRSVAQPRRS